MVQMYTQVNLYLLFVLQFFLTKRSRLFYVESKMDMETIRTQEDISTALERSHDEAVYIYKHSHTCPYNARAQGEVVKLKHDYPIYGLVVQYVKDLSNAIAETLDVKHETPQAILLKDGKAVNVLSHEAITSEAMLEALKEYS